MRGITTVRRYLSMAGELDVVLIPGGAMDDLILVDDEDRMGYKPFNNRGWYTEKMGKTGDSTKWQVLGEYTFKVSSPFVMGYMYNLGL